LEIFMRNAIVAAIVLACAASAADQVKVEGGSLEGTTGRVAGIRIFKGVPFAAPPVGELRWKAPKPVASWTGVRKADEFGDRCIQTSPFPDQIWRDRAESEDCLSLAIWTAAKSASEHRPVMVWFYGGGFFSGSADEPRYDGEHLAAKGVVVVNVNYRLGLMGFYAHPELTEESDRNASGNYGLMDQTAALEWVQKNIAAFGGDPRNVTIFGESAGSFSVSAQMASPLAKGLFVKAIGESGAFFPASAGGLDLISLKEAEQRGVRFAAAVGATSLAALRAKPASELREVSVERHMTFGPIVDGYFMPTDALTIYSEGRQARVPLLAGWNRDEVRFVPMMSKEKPTAAAFPKQLKTQFGAKADAALKVYPSGTDAEAKESAGDLASDNFISYSTWKWIELQAKTSGKPVYRYLFSEVAPFRPPSDMKPEIRGASHASEIDYVFDSLDLSKAAWTDADRKLADQMSSYWTNFAKHGDPNGAGLPKWPAYSEKTGYEVMTLDADSHATPAKHRDRYEFLDSVAADARAKK
jgi:para-nitrobenzyl esterase